MRNRYLRLAVSFAAALAITFLLLVSTAQQETVYRTVVVVSKDIQPNTPLNAQNLLLKNIPAEAVPSGALAVITVGKVAGQMLWQGFPFCKIPSNYYSFRQICYSIRQRGKTNCSAPPNPKSP